MVSLVSWQRLFWGAGEQESGRRCEQATTAVIPFLLPPQLPHLATHSFWGHTQSPTELSFVSTVQGKQERGGRSQRLCPAPHAARRSVKRPNWLRRSLPLATLWGRGLWISPANARNSYWALNWEENSPRVNERTVFFVPQAYTFCIAYF